MTQEEIQELKDLCAKAQPGPWYAHIETGVYEENTNDAYFVSPYEHDPSDAICAMDGGTFENFQFMAAARNAMPALITALEEAKSRIAYYEGVTESWVENALGVVGHRFNQEGICIRCGVDAEDCDMPCSEGTLKELDQAQAIIEVLDKAAAEQLGGQRISEIAKMNLIATGHPAFC